MRYRFIIVLTTICIMFSMVSCKKSQNANGNNNTDSGSATTTMAGESATEGSTEFTPAEVNDNVTIELPEDGTYVGH